MFPSDEQNLAVWDTPHGRWRSPLLHPGVGAHKHHDTFVFITSFRSVNVRRIGTDSGTWLFPGEKDGPGFPCLCYFWPHVFIV